MKIDLKSLTVEELKNEFYKMGEKPFRGEQVFKWIHQKRVNSFSDITVLSKNLRDKLEQNYELSSMKIVERYDSKIDGTKKYLFLLDDGNIIESVMMKYKHGISICISTQVGCKMGCTFCASTKGGWIRNLSPREMLDQIYKIQEDLDVTVSNIVLMGTGEPLDNYDNVLKFLNIIHDEKGQNLGYRHIALSTCGIVPKIYELADEKLPITLSISLHSPSQEKRSDIMPISKKYPISQVIDACKYYIDKTNRRITFEYTLIQGINDREADAKELSDTLKGILCHVNLIPLNPIKESELRTSENTYVNKFKKILEKNKISTTVRREMGRDINAACGQLRIDYLNKKREL